ncbi:iron sulfur cluster assembly protein mitochondrial precursor [Grosmannia clavigera kw1407]|uniref:Iron-sulfur cluster assembly protein n=1 Tax=Grosmannia clavigera (strain kw1407 / UAMH 11150) TaxID=655863 RepID=F0XA97_GROCL|nr:iron sulfur cluster assembly protein mitochondrial precursor [Grosmannia clavigera kw1407]EFX05709.1 iron sulfur cluster assembly protein mitochondrial precursor [Grosmannia clavigera kw1407]
MFSARTLISRPILASAASAVAISSARTAFRTARPTIAASAAVVPSARRLYHEKVIDHYTRPRNVGSLDRKDPSVGSGLVGAPACGDVMKLDIRVDPVTNKIIEAKFKTFGCGSAIASSSYLTTLVQGKSLDDAAAIRNVDIASELCLPPVKLHCSMLAEDAIKAAVADYRSKRPQTNLGGTGKTISQAPPAPQAAAAAI